jgi:hypothetical protein
LFLCFFVEGARKEASPESKGIIPPAFFMMLTDADLHEGDYQREETLTSPHSTNSDSFMSLLRAVTGRFLELPQTERKRRPRHVSGSAQRYHGTPQRSTKSASLC